MLRTLSLLSSPGDFGAGIYDCSMEDCENWRVITPVIRLLETLELFKDQNLIYSHVRIIVPLVIAAELNRAVTRRLTRVGVAQQRGGDDLIPLHRVWIKQRQRHVLAWSFHIDRSPEVENTEAFGLFVVVCIYQVLGRVHIPERLQVVKVFLSPAAEVLMDASGVVRDLLFFAPGDNRVVLYDI